MIMLNDYLPRCQFFDNWYRLTRLSVFELSNRDSKSFIHKGTLNKLKDYAGVYGVQDFKPKRLQKGDKVFAAQLFRGLRWEDLEMNLDLQSNSDAFKNAAALVSNVPFASNVTTNSEIDSTTDSMTDKLQDKKPVNPTDFL
ncbi:unnamed protein product [Ambrosiozyma monospora]|uniref:Unnamed protein product n=1 Tax=Ambrosiozyma monospora TaxID=43982 RepID=A0A9W6WDN1_AMBMO|nr:unnamed protein product [Ambrosiozyma monospora]